MSRRNQNEPLQMNETEKDSGDKENSEKSNSPVLKRSSIDHSKDVESQLNKFRGPATRNSLRNSERKLCAKLAGISYDGTCPKSKNESSSQNKLNSSTSGDTMLESSCVCCVCQQRLPDVRALESHMLDHSLYLCPTCERCFKYKRSYENHRFICEDGGPKPTRFYPQGVKRPRKNPGEPQKRGPRRSRMANYREPFHLSYDSSKSSSLQSPNGIDKTHEDNFYQYPASVEKRIAGLEKLASASLSASEAHRKPKTSTLSHQSRSREDKRLVDCDLRTLALAAASVSPHSKAVIDLVHKDTGKPGETAEPYNHQQSFSSQFMLPSAFIPANGNPREPLFLWQGIEIQTESPLVMRLEGFNPLTEQHYLLYKCSLCGSIFPGMTLCMNHLSTHSIGSKEHSCDKCGAIFKWRSQLEVHEQVHVVMDNMAIANQSALIANRIEQQNHYDKQKPRELQIFGQSVLPPNSLYSVLPPSLPGTSDHNRQESSSEEAQNQTDSSNRLNGFKCNYCPKEFDRLFSLQRHERIHTGIKICFCKHCGRGFSERRNLRHHVIRFHSDVNQRELLRKTIRPKPRSLNSSHKNPSHKLVSFLKKTAVRILNTMEQSKYNPVDKALPSNPMSLIPLPKPNIPSEPIEEREIFSPPALPNPNSSEHIENEPIEKTTKLPDEGVTVVLPTDVLPEKTGSPRPEHTNNEEEYMEVLVDPKRSLIGSRRKGKPYRFAPNQTNEEDLVEIATSSFIPSTTSITQVKEEIDSASEGNSNYDLVSTSYSGTENSEDALPCNIPQHVTPHFKARLRGHGSFFSNYNPRLGVVNSPVARSQACRPQIGADGKYVYPCTYCFKTFCSTSDLNRHMDFHEDVRPFKCPFCSYFSRTNSQLKVHMMRHQGIKQFLCNLCNYNGVTQSDLNRHCKTRSHVMRERNSCTSCGVGFYTRTLLEEHMRIVDHSNDILPLDCVAASYDFIKKEDEEIEEGEIAEVRVIEEDSKNEDEIGLEANNNDYSFNSKNINLLANSFQRRKKANN